MLSVVLRGAFPASTKLDWQFNKCRYDLDGKNAPTAVLGICGRKITKQAELQPTS